ncbi:M20 aminoacylase family protein [Winogradskya consettensis]|uniref:Hippurate hydrolase n=1 Tax=Winogradskya consettensis TaxID=113560 RepID=A0A919W0L3_9ACTN|nr:M20/M25/M40 family metallo-hydrolase [Actinoplanes consettensis]GIM84230.1 hippurate hydrolase [Actinoplanes consettensis]
MSEVDGRTVSRRVVLGGVAAGFAGVLPVRKASPVGEAAIDAVAGRLDRELIALRRDLHRHPEGPGDERRTSGIVARRLRDAGLEVVTGVGGYGVVGVLRGARPGRTVAFRADMDAVPPQDQVNGGPDVAHLCGHDIHTAVGVGVAQVLAGLRHRLAGTVVFVFQPAEESVSGAAAMLADGAFARTVPVEIHALHCWAVDVGRFVVTPGFGLPGQDRGTVTLTGPDAAGRAERLAAALNALSTVGAPSTTEELDRLVADIERPDSPLREFVYLRAQAAQNQVQVMSRCWPERRYLAVREEIRRLAGPATVMFPADPRPAMVCPEPEGIAMQRYLTRTLGAERVGRAHAAVPFSGEDFGNFLDGMPGTYTLLGVRKPLAGVETSYPHFATFDPDERAIGHGVRVMAGWLSTRSRTLIGV